MDKGVVKLDMYKVHELLQSPSSAMYLLWCPLDGEDVDSTTPLIIKPRMPHLVPAPSFIIWFPPLFSARLGWGLNQEQEIEINEG